MRPSLLRITLGLLLALPFPASAQLQVSARGASLTIGGRVQAQYSRSSVDGEDGGTDAVDDFFFRRARLELDLRMSDLVDGRLQNDFASGGIADAYLRLNLDPALRLSFGQFKRPFSIFELSSSTDLPIIERDGRVEGATGCPGVGGVCTFSRLTEVLQFDDRDIGARAEGRLGRIEYVASVTNGQGRNAADVNDAKSVSARLTVVAGERLRVSGFTALHDHPGDAPDDTDYGQAVGADLEVGTFRDGFHLLAGVVAGENWLVGPDAELLTAQGLASFYVPLEGRLAGLEPLLRASWSTTDAEEEEEVRALLLTPGVLLYLEGRNALGLNLDWYDPETGSSEWSLKAQAFLYY